VDLRVFGVHTVLELAPVLLAVERLSGGKAQVSNGGVAHLGGAGRPQQAAAVVSTAINSAPPLQGSGLADVATNAETQALRLSLERPDLRIIMTISEGLYRIVARRSAGIASVRDLAGKRVGTFPWTSAAYYLHKELQNAGLNDDAVDIRGISPPGELSKALINRSVDAIAIWEPASQDAFDALGTDAIELRTPGLYRELFNLNTTADKLADPTTRRQIVELVRAVVIACNDITDRPETVWPLTERTTSYRPELIRKSWPHHRFVGTLAADLLDVMVDEEKWSAGERNRRPRAREELAKLIDDSVLREAT
jgi:NitT/TauT family transport system substrate-binding protein